MATKPSEVPSQRRLSSLLSGKGHGRNRPRALKASPKGQVSLLLTSHGWRKVTWLPKSTETYKLTRCHGAGEWGDFQPAQCLRDPQWSVCGLLSNAPHLADLTTTAQSLLPDCSWAVSVYCRTKDSLNYPAMPVQKASGWTGAAHSGRRPAGGGIGSPKCPQSHDLGLRSQRGILQLWFCAAR